FLTDIAFDILVPEDRHLGKAVPFALDDFRDGIGDPILMDDRDIRDFQPEHGARLPCIVAGGADDMLTGDVAAIGPDLPLAARRPFEALDLGLEIDLGAAVTRAFRHGLSY